jgi:hypothetical protein
MTWPQDIGRRRNAKFRQLNGPELHGVVHDRLVQLFRGIPLVRHIRLNLMLALNRIARTYCFLRIFAREKSSVEKSSGPIKSWPRPNGELP